MSLNTHQTTYSKQRATRISTPKIKRKIGAGLMTMIQKGQIKPVIDKVLPLEQAAEGLRLIQDRKVIGKVVVTP